MLKISQFRTEHRENPLGISAEKPKFSWKYSELSGKQTEYRVIVSSSREKSLEGIGDVWDSGQVKSCECVAVEYGGKALSSRTLYFVRVFVKNDVGEEADSGINTFETAITDESDWKASWTAMPANFNGGTLRFRKVLDMPQGRRIKRARAYVCGLGYHEFYVNGVKISDDLLSPSLTEYGKRLEYVVYDFTAALDENDKNVVAFELGNGWYGYKKLYAQFYVDFEDGTTYEDHSAPVHGWWVAGSPTVANSLYGGETYDATLEEKYPLNWATRDFEPTWANGWMYTIATDAPIGKLCVREIEPIRAVCEYAPVSVKDMGDGVFVYDVGQNLAGRAKITVVGDRGSSVVLRFGEDVDACGYANQLNLRSAECTDKYILKGAGEEKFAPRFTYHGFRYVQAEISGNARILSLVAEHVHTDVETVGEFSCSDETLNKLHKNAVMTELNNLHSIMTDCPQRDERFGWLNDLGSRLFESVYNCRLDRFLTKFERDIADGQTEEGAIKDTAPYYTGGIPADPVDIAYLLIAKIAYKYYGDIGVINEHYDGMKRWVDYLVDRSDKYIMDYYYYADWVPPECFNDVKTDGIYISTVYLYWHLRLMSEIAAIAGNSRDSAYYAARAEESKRAITARYYDGKKKIFASGTQSENAIALWLGLVPDGDERAVAENIVEDVVRHGDHSTCGNVGYRHLFYALSDYGYADKVYDILVNPEYPGWGYMIVSGATTVWERWESEMQNVMHSFDHPMFGAYDAWLYRYVGGIAVDEDAFACDKVTIKPAVLKKLSRCETSFDTPRGKIVSAWKKEQGGKVSYHIEIPPTTVAKAVIDGKEFTLTCGKYDF